MIGKARARYSVPDSLQELDMRLRWVGAIVLAAALSSCLVDKPLEADSSLAAFVGGWRATSLVLSTLVAPDVSVDLIELGSTFDLNIQPNGSYTAVLAFVGEAQTEIGRISLSGASTVILAREFPAPRQDISTFVFEGPDHLILDGDTEFDFNLDGTLEPALSHFDLQRQLVQP